MQSIIIINIGYISVLIKNKIPELLNKFYIQEHPEVIFDYVISYGVNKVLEKYHVNSVISIMNNKHIIDIDLYRCVYDELNYTIGNQIEILIDNLFISQSIVFNRNDIIKIVVTYNDLIIVKSNGTIF